jgi:uncharacterized membrane protein YgaE (UPF0421/DUF939 family)
MHQQEDHQQEDHQQEDHQQEDHQQEAQEAPEDHPDTLRRHHQYHSLYQRDQATLA